MTVPKLRFKDDNGNDYPAWEMKKFGDVMDDFSYGMNVASKCFDGRNKYIRITDIDESTHKYDSSDIVSPDGKLEQKYLVKDGDILFARTGASVGKSYLYNSEDGNLYFAGFLIRGRVKSSYNPYFIYLQTLTFNYKKWVDIFSMRTGQPGINAEEYRSFKFLCPSLPEQKKIADFLSSFDKRIETTQKKLATLEKLKKGFMQKIFSQQLRFKDDNGNDYPAWEEKRLGEVTVKYKGNTLSKDNLDSEGMYPCLLYGELYTTYGPIASTILSRTNKLGKGMWVSEKDDVVVPVSGETAIDISTATCIKQNGVVIGGDLLILHSSRILGDFLSYSLNYPLKLTIAKYAQGASIVHMNIDSLMKVHIKFPSLPEQQKIADFLSAFDKKIDLVRKEVDTLQTIKKGLLQQMFV